MTTATAKPDENSTAPAYSVWRSDTNPENDGWTTLTYQCMWQGRRAPLRLTLEQAKEFLNHANNVGFRRETFKGFEIRQVLPDNTSAPYTPADTPPETSPKATTMTTATSTLNSFRLGDIVYVPFDGVPIAATIIGKTPQYAVLGWRDNEPSSSTALPRMKGSSPSYVANEGEYTYSCTAKLDTPCTMFLLPSTLANACLGDAVELFIDANSNIVYFPTHHTVKTTCIGRDDDGRFWLGWKDGEPIPNNVKGSGRSQSACTYIEGESLYYRSWAAQPTLPCLLPTKRQTQISEMTTKLNTLDATIKNREALLASLDAKVAAKQQPQEAPKKAIKHGQRVRWRDKCNGVYVEYGVKYSNNQQYMVLLDQPIDMRCNWQNWNDPDAMRTVAAEFGFTINDEGTNFVLASKDNPFLVPIEDEPIKAKTVDPKQPFTHGQRVRWTRKNDKTCTCNGTVANIGFERESLLVVLLDEPLDYGCIWQRSVIAKELLRAAREFNFTLNDEGTNWAWAGHYNCTAIEEEPTTKAQQDAKAVEEPETTKTEPIEQETDSGVMGAIAIGTAAFVGATINAISKANSKTEIVRIVPPTNDDAIAAQLVAEATELAQQQTV